MAVTDNELPKDLPGERPETGATDAPVDGASSSPRRLFDALWRGLGSAVLQLRRVLAVTIFSSLARRIIVLNLAGLAVLVVGILFLNQWRTGLIEARVQSLRV